MPHKLPVSPPETGAYSVLVGTALFFVLGGWILAGGPLTGLAVRDTPQWIPSHKLKILNDPFRLSTSFCLIHIISTWRSS